MGLFDKIKKIFKREEKDENEEILEKENLKEIDIEPESSNDDNLQKGDTGIHFDKEENTKADKKQDAEAEKKSVKVYEKGLTKTRENFVSKLINLTNKYNKVTEEYFDELEEILIMADIGVNTVMDFMDRLRKRVKSENITDFEYLKEVIVDELFMIYVGDDILSSKLNIKDGEVNVILFVGVNGVGKTTSIAKLGNKLIKEGKKVLYIAGDTFRAGACEQLKLWAQKTNALFYGDDRSDPSAIVYDGLKYAIDEKVDVVLVDTAGRLQNKVNLMKELEKINKVISSIIPNNPCETLLVIDASTGQNGISQAKSFKEITNVTGIILTKFDGTAKGGIVLAIRELVNIPVKYIGFGEKMDDLMVFDIEKYIYGLFKEF